MLQCFHPTVHFVSGSSSGPAFFLVVVFGPSSFHLDEDSVGLALNACLGGDPAGFDVQQLSVRCFCFFSGFKTCGTLSDLSKATPRWISILFFISTTQVHLQIVPMNPIWSYEIMILICDGSLCASVSALYHAICATFLMRFLTAISYNPMLLWPQGRSRFREAVEES